MKSFEDLHKLWFVLLKERNLLSTQKTEFRRMGLYWSESSRDLKCRLSMARLKTVLSERARLHKLAVALDKEGLGGQMAAEAKLRAQSKKEHRHSYRKFQNFLLKRSPLFH